MIGSTIIDREIASNREDVLVPIDRETLEISDCPDRKEGVVAWIGREMDRGSRISCRYNLSIGSRGALVLDP